ncbi:MAG TPA: hypothetical protein VIK18_09320, partial [Pirellulales bacterium]
MSRRSWHDWIVSTCTRPRAKRGRKARPKGWNTPRQRWLTFEALEARQMLATFADTATALNLVLGTNQNAAVISTGTTYSLTLSSGTWTGTNDAKVTGNGSATLVVTSAGLAAFTSGVNITDTGSTGGDGVTFSNSQASAYFNSFDITLADSASAGGLSFNGPTTFNGSAALIAAASGSVIINAAATLNMGSGSLSLAATGSNVALTASGNIISQGGSITLAATGAVTVASGVTINSGSGTLTLAADVTAAGAGDDGVGTLTISAGATVTSSNTSAGAITLRGADVGIDTSSNPAVVGANRVLGTTASAAYSAGLYYPIALAFDSSGNLYVGNNSTVEKFAPGSTTPSATYSAGVDEPYALAFDSSGNLYVANYGNNTVEEFAPGSTTASATYSAGVINPVALAFDSSGNLYVANAYNNTVEKFAKGSTTASATYSAGVYGPDALA